MHRVLTLLLAFALGVLATALWQARERTPQASATVVTAAPGPTAALPQAATAPASYPPDRWPARAPTPEQVLYNQPALLDTAVHTLSPRQPGRPNLYLLVFAADGSEDVFHNEADYAARLFRQRFGPATHALVLENNPATLETRPLANWSNLEHALDALAKVMDPQQDILMLYLTTHGSHDHTLLVDMDPLPLDQIGAADLADILAEQPFKWKVVVVNACYSGGFIPELKGPGTLVLTAARSDRSSFGCGSESKITYFGHAWLVNALNQTSGFIDAFGQARREIAGWEKQDQLTPSQPQIDVGAGIQAQLERWRQHVDAGPPVPFKPARSAAR